MIEENEEEGVFCLMGLRIGGGMKGGVYKGLRE